MRRVCALDFKSLIRTQELVFLMKPDCNVAGLQCFMTSLKSCSLFSVKRACILLCTATYDTWTSKAISCKPLFPLL